jgi:feruloyl esterase
VTWVENGTAPETILATKFVNDTPVAKYSGSGSTNDAANFTCITDERDFNQTPAPQIGP